MENRSRFIPFFIAVASVILIFSYGCKEDFFDVTSGDRITPDQHYRTLIDADVSLKGVLIPLQDAMPRLIMLDGLRSDMMEVTPNADSYLRELNHHILSASNPLTNPSDLYKVIVNINEVLANIDRIAATDREYDALTAYTYKGALLGMRAWTYLTLVRLYNKAVYIENNLTTIPENLSQKTLSKEVMLDTLINQLEKYFQSEYTTTKYNEIRIPNYVNNKALLGELYLEVGRYSDAVAYLKLACESYGNTASMLKVDRTYQNAAWSNIFLNAESNNIENISAIPFSRAEQQFNPIANWVGRNYQYAVRPSKVLVDSFMVQIPSLGVPGDLWRGKGFTFEADTLSKINDSTFITETYITKYAIDREDPFSSDIIISRAGDIHLLLAEAYNRLGDETSQRYAMILLNQGFNKENPKPAPFARWASNLGIRGRAYLKSRELPDSLSADSVTLLIEDFIIAERALELAFEGKRWFDLVRVAERRNDPAFLADKVAAKFEGTNQYDAIRNKLMNPANWYLPFE